MAVVVDGAELISAHLRPCDLLALSAASRRLHAALAAADKPWLAQCRRLFPSSPSHLLAWRAAADGSSLAVCRFLHSVSPLRALWAHQNPELGNLVTTLPGFFSLVAVRAIPQELSPRLLWAPVFEILADARGRPVLLFLHGHHPGSLSPGLLAALNPHANTLLLEAHAPDHSSSPSSQFPRLSFGNRRRLLDALVASCRLTLPPELAAAPLFARSDEDLPVLAARREAMLRLHTESGGGMLGRPELEALLLGAKKMLPLPAVDAAGDKVRLRRSLSAMARQEWAPADGHTLCISQFFEVRVRGH